MKKTMQLLIALCCTFCSLHVLAQPCFNSKQNIYYRTKTSYEKRFSTTSNKRIFKFNTNSFNQKDSLNQNDSLMQIARPKEIRDIDDSLIIKKKYVDSLKAEIIKGNKDSTPFYKKMDSVSLIINAKTNERNSKFESFVAKMNDKSKYHRMHMVIRPMTNSIHSLLDHHYQNRLYIATFLVTKDTAAARNAVLNAQDSIKNLIIYRTNVREFRKYTRPFNFIPAISARSAKYFWGSVIDSNINKIDSATVIADSSNFSTFQNFGLLYASNKGNSSVVHAQLFSVYAGPVKVEGNTFFNLPKTDTTKDIHTINSLSSLAAGGGNVTVQLLYPILSLNVDQETFGDIHFSSIVNPKIAFDIPSSTDSGKYSEYTSLGIVNRLSVELEKTVQFFGTVSYSSIWGNSRFMDNIGLTGYDRQRFNFWSMSVGISLKTFTIQYTTYKGNNAILKNIGNTLTFTTSLN